MANTLPYEKITDALIAALENGCVPWQKPWVGAVPMNAFSKRAYRGINTIVLGFSPYSDPRWATYNQIAAHGGQVKKGSKSTAIVFWQFSKLKDKVTGKETTVPFLKYFNVFNVEQTEGLNLPTLAELMKHDHDPIEAAEEIAKGYATAPKVIGSQAAWYMPSADEVGMPAREQFTTAEGYYATLYHEFAHSTGHASRLNRKEVVNANRFGSGDYSQEELVAEMTAYFLCNAAGIANNRVTENTTAYLKSWISRLKDDVKMAVSAAGRAQRAADYILGIKQEDSDTDTTAVKTEDGEEVTAELATA